MPLVACWAQPTQGWDKIYSQPYFLGLVFVLAVSLAACSYTRQLPMLKVAKKWKFLNKRADFKKLSTSGGAADFYEQLGIANVEELLSTRGKSSVHHASANAMPSCNGVEVKQC